MGQLRKATAKEKNASKVEKKKRDGFLRPFVSGSETAVMAV